MKTLFWTLSLATAVAFAALPHASADNLDDVCDATGSATCHGIISDCQSTPIADNLCNPGCDTAIDPVYCGGGCGPYIDATICADKN